MLWFDIDKINKALNYSISKTALTADSVQSLSALSQGLCVRLSISEF